MASEAAEAVASVTTEAAAIAGERAAEAVAGVEAAAASAIAQAAERVEAAQAVAQQVTDAAVQNAVVQEVHNAIEDLDGWESGIESRIAAQDLRWVELAGRMDQMAAELLELRTTPPSVAVVTTDQPSTSPLSTEPETLTAVVVNPATAPNPSASGDVPLEAGPVVSNRARKKNWI